MVPKRILILVVILVFTAFSCSGSSSKSLGTPTGSLEPEKKLTPLGGFYPVRIAISGRYAYVSDYNNMMVRVFDWLDGKEVSRIGVLGRPLGVGVKVSGGHVLIYAGVGKEVRVFDEKGKYLRSLSYTFTKPNDIAVDSVSGNVYVLDSSSGKIVLFDAMDNLRQEFTVPNPGNQAGFFPVAMTLDQGSGRIFISEASGNSIIIVSTSGEYVGFYSKKAPLDSQGNAVYSEGVLIRNDGIDVDKDGRIYVVDSYAGICAVYNQDGSYLGRIGSFGSSSGELKVPLDVAVGYGEKKIYAVIASGDTQRLEVYEVSF